MQNYFSSGEQFLSFFLNQDYIKMFVINLKTSTVIRKTLFIISIEIIFNTKAESLF